MNEGCPLYATIQWHYIDKLSNYTVPNHTLITTNYRALFIYNRTKIAGWFPVFPLKNVLPHVHHSATEQLWCINRLFYQVYEINDDWLIETFNEPHFSVWWYFRPNNNKPLLKIRSITSITHYINWVWDRTLNTTLQDGNLQIFTSLNSMSKYISIV